MKPTIYVLGVIGRGLIRVAAQLDPVDVVRFVSIVGESVEELSDRLLKGREREELDDKERERRDREWRQERAHSELSELAMRVAVLEEDRAVRS
jgi:hypothetical protein